MEPNKEQVVGMLYQASKMIREVYLLNGVEYGTALQAYINTAFCSLAAAITHIDVDYKEEEDR